MLYIGADHAGFKLKEEMKKFLTKKKIKYIDLSPELKPKDDYPDIAKRVGNAVAKHNVRGMLICGTGMGVCMAANKVKRVRAALVYDNLSAKLSRQHNNANIICFGGRTTKKANAAKYFMTWYNSKFDKAQRHHRRVKKVNHM